MSFGDKIHQLYPFDEVERFIRIEMNNPFNGINFGIYEVKAYGTPLTNIAE